SRFADHWTPSGFVPSHRTIFECNLELAIIVIVFRDVIREPGTDGADADGFALSHLAHHIDVVHTTIHDRAQGGHEVSVECPHPGLALLIEIHPHDQGLPKLLGHFYELFPAWVVSEDVPHDQLFVGFLRCSNHIFCSLHAVGDGFFDVYVAS